MGREGGELLPRASRGGQEGAGPPRAGLHLRDVPLHEDPEPVRHVRLVVLLHGEEVEAAAARGNGANGGGGAGREAGDTVPVVSGESLACVGV